ncbi:MAG: thiamine pyrophosphate-dependent enzyme [Chloroflexota bacterium]
MPKLTGGEAVVKSLINQGVDTLFGLPGVQNDYFYNALYDEGGKIRVIHTRHEQGAAYMALGYAMALDQVGVYNVVPGPGLLNTTAALCTAYGTNAKVFCLTGEIPTPVLGRGFGMLHELPDQLGVIRSLTKWAEHVHNPAQAPSLVAEGFRQLNSGRPRPVGLQIPMDVLAAKGEVDLNVQAASPYKPLLDLDTAEEAAKRLGEAKFPLIIAGGGTQHAGEEIKQLAEMLQAPVAMHSMGKGVLDSRHALAVNAPTLYHLLKKADVVLAVGTRMSLPLHRWGLDFSERLININIDPEEHARMSPQALNIAADSVDALQGIIELVGKHNRVRPSRADDVAEARAIAHEKADKLEPQASYVRAIRAALPEDGIFVDEVTQIGFASRIFMDVYAPRTFISPGYQGTLGWGFATSLGVKVAQPDRPVVSVNGDGGFMFTMQELATAVQHKIGLVTLVFNNGEYGNVRRMQKENHGGRLIATDLANPDFVKMAESFGAQGLRAESPDALIKAIEQGIKTTDTPTIIDVPVGDMPSPWPILAAPQRVWQDA